MGEQIKNVEDECDCERYLDCCDCGITDGDGCGCIYCWSCNACDNCLE